MRRHRAGHGHRRRRCGGRALRGHRQPRRRMSGTASPKASMRRTGAAQLFHLHLGQRRKFSSRARASIGASTPFAVRAADIDKVQYGSDDTKTHRKIKHILGTQYRDRVGRLLVSELFTVGQAAGPAFRRTSTTRTACRSRPAMTRPIISASAPHHGFGLQLVQREDGKVGDAYHIVDGSTVFLDKGYHPCVAAPGYEMYYFTILGGPEPAAAGAVLPARPCLSGRDHSRHQGHDREIQMTIATLRRGAHPGLHTAMPWRASSCSAGRMRVAFVEAAEEAGLPIILQAGPGCRRHTPVAVLGKMFRHAGRTGARARRLPHRPCLRRWRNACAASTTASPR